MTHTQYIIAIGICVFGIILGIVMLVIFLVQCWGFRDWGFPAVRFPDHYTSFEKWHRWKYGESFEEKFERENSEEVKS